MAKEYNISDFQINLVHHLEVKYSKLNKSPSVHDVNRYIFEIFDILMYGLTIKTKINKLKNIKIIGTRRYLFNKKEAAFIVHSYSKIIKSYVLSAGEENQYLSGGVGKGPTCINNTLNDISDAVRNLIMSRINKVVGTRTPVMRGKKLVDDAYSTIRTGIPRRFDAIIKHITDKGLESLGLEKRPKAFVSGFIKEEEGNVMNVITSYGNQLPGTVIADTEKLSATVAFSALAEVIDVALEFLGFLVPTGVILGEINTLIMCNPERIWACAELFLPGKSQGQPHASYQLKMILLISEIDSGITCCGEMLRIVEPGSIIQGENFFDRMFDKLGVAWIHNLITVMTVSLANTPETHYKNRRKALKEKLAKSNFGIDLKNSDLKHKNTPTAQPTISHTLSRTHLPTASAAGGSSTGMRH